MSVLENSRGTKRARSPGLNEGGPRVVGNEVPESVQGKTAWQVIEPYLDLRTRRRGSTQPDMGREYEKALAHLPALRTLVNNPQANHGRPRRPFTIQRHDEIDTALVYVAGKRMSPPCEACQRGNGPLHGCVVPSSSLGLPPSCQNCDYHKAHKCSFSGMAPREPLAEGIPALVAKPPDGWTQANLTLTHVAQLVWQVLQPYTRSTYAYPPRRLDSFRTLGFKVPLRPLLANPKSHNPYSIGNADNLVSGLVYLTGATAKTPCTACASGAGPLSGCIVATPDLGLKNKCGVACSNCMYNRNHDDCSILIAAVGSADHSLTDANPVPELDDQAPPAPDNHGTLDTPVIAMPSSPEDGGRGFELAGPGRPVGEVLMPYVLQKYDYPPKPTQWTILFHTLANRIPVRQLFANPDTLRRNCRWPLQFRIYQNCNLETGLIHLLGEEAPQPCRACAASLGTLHACVVLRAEDRQNENHVSCSNCTYHGGAKRCSFYVAATERETVGVEEAVEAEKGERPEEHSDSGSALVPSAGGGGNSFKRKHSGKQPTQQLVRRQRQDQLQHQQLQQVQSQQQHERQRPREQAQAPAQAQGGREAPHPAEGLLSLRISQLRGMGAVDKLQVRNEMESWKAAFSLFEQGLGVGMGAVDSSMSIGGERALPPASGSGVVGNGQEDTCADKRRQLELEDSEADELGVEAGAVSGRPDMGGGSAPQEVGPLDVSGGEQGHSRPERRKRRGNYSQTARNKSLRARRANEPPAQRQYRKARKAFSMAKFRALDRLKGTIDWQSAGQSERTKMEEAILDGLHAEYHRNPNKVHPDTAYQDLAMSTGSMPGPDGANVVPGDKEGLYVADSEDGEESEDDSEGADGDVLEQEAIAREQHEKTIEQGSGPGMGADDKSAGNVGAVVDTPAVVRGVGGRRTEPHGAVGTTGSAAGASGSGASFGGRHGYLATTSTARGLTAFYAGMAGGDTTAAAGDSHAGRFDEEDFDASSSCSSIDP